MALNRISDNQIKDTTSAIIDTLNFLDGESVLRIPTGTGAQRPGTPSVGTLRYNTTEDSAEIYKADDGSGNPGWSSVGGGGPSLGEDSVIRTNQATINENITIGPTANNGDEFTYGFSHGPITLGTGFTITVESGATWTIIGAHAACDSTLAARV